MLNISAKHPSFDEMYRKFLDTPSVEVCGSEEDYYAMMEEYYNNIYGGDIPPYMEEIEIRFYRDFAVSSDFRVFKSLKEFNDFCSENNYKILSEGEEILLTNTFVCCCLDPYYLEVGRKVLAIETSYVGLYNFVVY